MGEHGNLLAAPPLERAGLLLRPLARADAAAVASACQDKETQRWLPLSRPYTESTASAFIEDVAPVQLQSSDGVVRAIELGGRLAGCIDLMGTDWAARTTEIGYWVAPLARRQGVASRATRLLAQWVLTAGGAQRVELQAALGNIGSQRVAESAGRVREGCARNAGFVHGGRVDLVLYSLVPADLERSRP